MTDGLRKWAELTAHAAFIVACAVLVYVVVTRSAEPPRPPAQSGFADERLLEATEVRPLVADTAVFVGVQSTCRYCTASMDFYRRLAQVAADGIFELVVGSREPVERTRDYLAAHGVAASRVISVTGDVPVPATPTLLLIEKSGKVRRSWLGQLDDEQEEEVLNLVRGNGRE